jgi:NAD(P)-dependent dehydrogenase (short-subunit alcohol dehydrogenase family)
MRFKDKVAVVTGGGSGIGRAAAELFARDGARVLVADYKSDTACDTVKAIEAAGGQAMSVEADVSKAADVARMTDAAIQAYGRIDILFNAAGVLFYGTILETDEQAWDRVISINLTGTYLCCRAVLPHMLRQGGGAIINTSSTAGAHAGVAHAVAYCSSKGGVMMLTRAMAIDHSSQGIRVNALCPGPTDTPMLRDALTPEEFEAFGKTYPAGRLGRPEELANAVLFLASEEASFVTGTMMFVDGGQTAQL